MKGNFLKAVLYCVALCSFFCISADRGLALEYKLALRPGWNLISLPLQPSDNSSAAVLAGISESIEAVFSYDGTSYLTYIPKSSLNTLLHMNAGTGYWIYMNRGENLALHGSIAPRELKLTIGWNLTGLNSTSSMPITKALESIHGKYAAVFAFDTLLNSYMSYTPEEGGLSTLDPGRGYWIYVNEEITWRLPSIGLPDESKAIERQMVLVADWQIKHPSMHPTDDWTQATFYAGLISLAKLTNDPRYWHLLKSFGEKNGWKLGSKRYYADHQIVGWLYQEIYSRERDQRFIKPTQEVLDYILANPSKQSLKMPDSLEARRNVTRWNWCDALFMAPPVWARMSAITGNPKYLEFMNREWWAVTNYLYDKSEHLYYRDDRYFSERERNGKKVFWSRGNGWVLAGIARVLEVMPEDFADRPKYINLFKEMAMRVKEVQGSDGMWRPSLLAPASYPVQESSSSALFCYGLAWGINNGILDRSVFLPSVEKAWKGLQTCVTREGKLGYVQPIGADPASVKADNTEVYGVGAYLLAGSEMFNLTKIAIN